MDLRLMILKKFGPQGSVCPHPGAIYMYITMIFNDLLGGPRCRAVKSAVS